MLETDEERRGGRHNTILLHCRKFVCSSHNPRGGFLGRDLFLVYPPSGRPFPSHTHHPSPATTVTSGPTAAQPVQPTATRVPRVPPFHSSHRVDVSRRFYFIFKITKRRHCRKATADHEKNKSIRRRTNSFFLLRILIWLGLHKIIVSGWSAARGYRTAFAYLVLCNKNVRRKRYFSTYISNIGRDEVFVCTEVTSGRAFKTCA